MKSPQRTEAGLLVYGRTNKREAAVLQFAKQCQAVTWDFSKDGGAVGDIGFGVKLPAGAIVTGIWADREAAVTGATDLKLYAGATALSAANDFTTGAAQRSVALATTLPALPAKLAAAAELSLKISTAAATAGKVTFFVEFVEKP